jgi:hypothetical protein
VAALEIAAYDESTNAARLYQYRYEIVPAHFTEIRGKVNQDTDLDPCRIHQFKFLGQGKEIPRRLVEPRGFLGIILEGDGHWHQMGSQASYPADKLHMTEMQTIENPDGCR